MEAAGFDTRVAVEMDSDCAATLRANRDWPLFDDPIGDVPSSELLARAGLHIGEADILIGGPPCQPFSKCGYWATGDARRLDDPRANTVEAFLRVLKDTQPRVYLMENVAGLAFSGKSEGLHLIEKTIGAINEDKGTQYGVELRVLNAVDFGVPQSRERAFLIGARNGSRFGDLIPTHRPAIKNGQSIELSFDDNPQTQRTAWDALWDLDDDEPELEMRGKWADLLPSIPEGENYLFHTERGGGKPLFGWRRRYWNFLLKLAKNQPSWTLTAQPGPATGPFHWKSRRLSARELCRLQTIPDDFRVLGSLSAVQRQVGNAVPSALAEKMGLEIRHRLLGEKVARQLSPSLIPPKRNDTPAPEAVKRIAKKYLGLVGDHEEHPGTGKGYRALHRASSN